MTVLPMFPLGNVLLPGALLPLHVFEPRYQALVRACVAVAPHEFGVALIDRGSEVGGGDRRRDIGVVARMVQVAQIADDRFGVIAVGVRRVRIAAWLPDAPYPLADVDDWPDEPCDAADLAAMVADLAPRVRRAAALALELGDPARGSLDDLNPDPALAVYQLVGQAPLGAADQYELLCARTALERLAALGEKLDDIEPMLQFRLQS